MNKKILTAMLVTVIGTVLLGISKEQRMKRDVLESTCSMKSTDCELVNLNSGSDASLAGIEMLKISGLESRHVGPAKFR